MQVLSLQESGIKLGTFKSINESITRVAVYISLLTLYCLGGSKVKAVSTTIEYLPLRQFQDYMVKLS